MSNLVIIFDSMSIERTENYRKNIIIITIMFKTILLEIKIIFG